MRSIYKKGGGVDEEEEGEGKEGGEMGLNELIEVRERGW